MNDWTIRIMLKKLSLAGKLSLFIILIYCICAIAAPKLTPFLPNRSSGERFMPHSLEHPMGTDDLAYDIFAQILYGARTSMIVGIGTAFFSTTFGTFAGITAGYFGGNMDRFIMRIIDILISIPAFPLMVLLSSFIGTKIIHIIFVLSLLSWTRIARLVRAQVLVLKESSFVKMSRLFGASFLYMVRVHLLPDLKPIIRIHGVRQINRAIVSEASLSFIGLGDATSSSWGRTLNNATGYRGIYRTDYWKWWLTSPLLTMFILVFAFAVLARELERQTS